MENLRKYFLPSLSPAQMIDPDRNKKKVKRAVPVGQGGFIERRVEKKSQDHAAEQQGQADPVIVRLEVFEKAVEGDQEQKRAVKRNWAPMDVRNALKSMDDDP